MSERPPPGWFARQSNPAYERAYARRRAGLLNALPGLMAEEERRDRADRFLPYLLIRTALGDGGDRPINVPFWESPDIWTALGDPANTPAIPPDHGGTVQAGHPATLYAHVWNLGLAPLAGVRVEFYWIDPSVGVGGNLSHLIGMARCELAGRGMQGSHKLVKCPTAWVPAIVNGGHECLFARVSGIGDPIGNNDWDPNKNRHVGQRNIAVVAAGTNVTRLIAQLDASRPAGTRLQLIQVGPREGELVRRVAIPRLRLADLKTQVLGEIDARQRVGLGDQTKASGGMLASVHPLAAGKAPAPPPIQRDPALPIIDPSAILGLGREGRGEKPPPGARAAEAAKSEGRLAELLGGVAALRPRARRLPPPRPGEAQLLRIATYAGDRLVGGYTIVITGHR
jgi:hypothetical protein